MNRRFEVTSTPIEGLLLLQRQPLGDSRGYLERMFCTQELADLLGGRQIVQVNHTLTAISGTVRGMHFQYPPHAEMKCVSCLRGQVFDVAVDLRRNSSTFLHWHGQLLSRDNHQTLIIPEGFAHGFQTLTDDCEMIYLHTHAYAAAAEGALNATDPRVGIEWPQSISERSARDVSHPLLSDDFPGVQV